MVSSTTPTTTTPRTVTLDVMLELPADVVEYLGTRSPAGHLRRLIENGKLASAVGELIAEAESSRRGVEHHDLGLYGPAPETWTEFKKRRRAERKAEYDRVVTLEFVRSVSTPSTPA